MSSKQKGLTGMDRWARYCPYKLLNDYIDLRQSFPISKRLKRSGPMFIFADGSPVQPCHLCLVLRKGLKSCRLYAGLYDCHSLRIGHATDLTKPNVPVSHIKHIGHWKYQFLNTRRMSNNPMPYLGKYRCIPTLHIKPSE